MSNDIVVFLRCGQSQPTLEMDPRYIVLFACVLAVACAATRPIEPDSSSDSTDVAKVREKRGLLLAKAALLGGAALGAKKALVIGGAALGAKALGAKALLGAGLLGAGLYKAKYYGGGYGGGYHGGYGGGVTYQHHYVYPSYVKHYYTSGWAPSSYSEWY